jgi:hypothetical protein
VLQDPDCIVNFINDLKHPLHGKGV